MSIVIRDKSLLYRHNDIKIDPVATPIVDDKPSNNELMADCLVKMVSLIEVIAVKSQEKTAIAIPKTEINITAQVHRDKQGKMDFILIKSN